MNNSHTYVCHYYYMRTSAGLLNRPARSAARLLNFAVQCAQTCRHIHLIMYFGTILIAMAFKEIVRIAKHSIKRVSSN